MLIAVFDTETTGLPKTKIIDKEVLHLWPHILQFSYVIFDTATRKIVKTHDSIIDVGPAVEISEESVRFHKITADISREKGCRLIDSLCEFFEDIANTPLIVGHNVSFDINMLKVELIRLLKTHKNPKLIQQYLNMLETVTVVCTMQNSVDLCAIERKDRFGKTYNKFPQLAELHQHLFHTTPHNLHNALTDVIVCLRCFMSLQYNIDIVMEGGEDVDHAIALFFSHNEEK